MKYTVLLSKTQLIEVHRALFERIQMLRDLFENVEENYSIEQKLLRSVSALKIVDKVCDEFDKEK